MMSLFPWLQVTKSNFEAGDRDGKSLFQQHAFFQGGCLKYAKNITKNTLAYFMTVLKKKTICFCWINLRQTGISLNEFKQLQPSFFVQSCFSESD